MKNTSIEFLSENERRLEQDYIPRLASRIYNTFAVGEYCHVMGYTDYGRQSVQEAGRAVLDILAVMYTEEWTYKRNDRKARKRRYIEFSGNVVGGPIAHKAFGWSRVIIDKIPVYNIWRCQ